jgi:signal transduction histidine kinase
MRQTLESSEDLAPSAPVSKVAGLTLKAALLLGFGVTLSTWLVAGYGMRERMRGVEEEIAAINVRFDRAQDVLSEVSTQVLIASILVRDGLNDPDPAAGPLYRRRFEETFGRADAALRAYQPVLNLPSERAALLALGDQIDDLRAEMDGVWGAEGQPLPQDAHRWLQERVVPKRTAVLGVSEQIRKLNRNVFIQQQTETRRLNRQAQEQALRRIGLAVGASLLIGALATAYAARLETRLRRQRARDMLITANLHRLSERLATAQEDERRGIARELHDEVGQALTAIKVEVSIAQRSPGVPPAAVERLDDARQMTEDALHTIRDLSHLLHPPLLDDLGLAAALKHQLETFGRRHGIRAVLEHEPSERRFAPEIEVALYRIVQEALTNIAKHAHASTCRVTVLDGDTSVQVTIDDDGSGFDAAEVEHRGHARGIGLIGMKERAHHLGGTLRIDSAPGHGTRLTVVMPARRDTTPPVDTTPARAGVSEMAATGEIGIHGKPAHLSR